MSTWPAPSPRPPSRNWPLTLAVVAGLVVAFLLGAGLLALAFAPAAQEVELFVLLLIALVPLFIVLPVFLWLDSFEREPGWLLLLGFAWGAVVATGFAMLGNEIGAGLLSLLGVDPQAGGAVIAAPLVEESAKGVFLLGLWLLRPRQLDGVVDGIVYAGVTAAGFAFTENIVYFARAAAEGGDGQVVMTFVARGIASPFAHPLFTACTGAAVGRAVLAESSGWRFALPVIGWCAAVLLHGIWNLSVVLGAGWLLVYLLFEVPIFVAFLVFVVMVRRYELRHVTRHLQAYVRGGWLSQREVAMVGHGPERREALQWAARTGGPDARRAMRSFQREAVHLAHVRARLDRTHRDRGPVGTRSSPAWELHEVARQQEALDELTRLRQRFAASRGAQPSPLRT